MWSPTVLVITFAFVAPVALCLRYQLSSTSYDFGSLSSDEARGEVHRQLMQKHEANNQPVFKLSCSSSGPFPYTASLRGLSGKHRCGAVLIHSDTVLTAASCVDPRNHDASDISQVYLGGFERDNPIQKRKVAATIIHDSYNGDPKHGYDIAILKLNKPSCLQPIPNIGRQTDVGENYTILGFGRPGFDENFTYTLLGANVTNFDFNHCNRHFGANPLLDEKRICTRVLGCDCAAACEGDEGGPLVRRKTISKFTDVLMGLFSYTNGVCGQPGSFSVHTDIQAYKNWIDTNLHSNAYINA